MTGSSAATDMAWMASAACRGMDPRLFFHARGANLQRIRRVCRRCPVRVDCLFYAIRNPHRTCIGIWGGSNRHERDELRRWDAAARRSGGGRQQ